MDTMFVDLMMKETPPFLMAEVIEEGSGMERKDAPESEALGASLVAFTTVECRNEYTTEADVCQAIANPSFEEIEAIIVGAARTRIAMAYRTVQDTRARLERERTARDLALQAAQERVATDESAARDPGK